MESGAKELVLFHHDPDHDDACIDKVVEKPATTIRKCGRRPKEWK